MVVAVTHTFIRLLSAWPPCWANSSKPGGEKRPHRALPVHLFPLRLFHCSRLPSATPLLSGHCRLPFSRPRLSQVLPRSSWQGKVPRGALRRPAAAQAAGVRIPSSALVRENLETEKPKSRVGAPGTVLAHWPAGRACAGRLAVLTEPD